MISETRFDIPTSPGGDANNFCRQSSQLLYQAAFLLFAIDSSSELGRWEQFLDVLLLFNFLSVELQEEPAFAHYEQLLVLVALYPRMDKSIHS